MSDWSDDLPSGPPMAPTVAPAPPTGPPSTTPTSTSTSASTVATTRPPHDRRRTVIGVVLALLAGVFAVGGIASYWATDEILSASTWQSTAKAIADDPVVQNDVADSISQQIVDAVGLESIISGVLPGVLSGLSGPIADKATELLSDATIFVVRTDAFATVWRTAISATHDQFVHAIDGSGGATTITSRGLELDLGGAFTAVQEQLAKNGIHVLDSVDASDLQISFLLVDAPGLDSLRTWVRTLRVLVIVLPALAVVCAIVAFVVARRRWYAVAALGAGGLLGAGIVSVILSSGRDSAVDELSGGIIGRSTSRVVVDHIGSGLDGTLLVSAAVALTVLVVGIMGVILASPRRTRPASRTGAPSNA